jgi:type II secretory pathway component PulF
LTSLTTIGGLTPLLFETSMQAQIMQPMAITMVFGIAVATGIVLVVVPALLGIVDDIGKFIPTIPDLLKAAYRWLRNRLTPPKSRA